MRKVVIIGSGMGGLVAGNLLAKKGHKVTIFEAHHTPGGYTAGFNRQGYYFESGTLGFEASSAVSGAMRDIGVFEKIDYVKLSMRFFAGALDGIPEDYEGFKKLVYSAYPSDKEKLDDCFAELDKMVYSADGQQSDLVYEDLKQYVKMTSSKFASRYFAKDSKLFELFSNFSYPDMPAIYLGASLAGFFLDYWTVKNGMQAWADVLTENFKQLGGDLLLNSYVDKIITQDGSAVGVSCNNTVYDADYVISASDYKKTLLKLLDDRSLVPQEYLERVEQAAVSESFFTVYLGLQMSNEELRRYMQVAYVLTFDVQPGYDIYNSADDEFFSKTSVNFYSPSLLNPELAPEGKSSLMLQTIVPDHWMDNWGGGDREVYKQLKTKATEAVIDSASRLIPGLRESIAYQDAATPLTYERFTQNTDGASSAWSWNPNKMFFDNPMSVNIDTPVKNLYIGSCWSMEFGGVPGALAAAYKCVDMID